MLNFPSVSSDFWKIPCHLDRALPFGSRCSRLRLRTVWAEHSWKLQCTCIFHTKLNNRVSWKQPGELEALHSEGTANSGCMGTFLSALTLGGLELSTHPPGSPVMPNPKCALALGGVTAICAHIWSAAASNFGQAFLLPVSNSYLSRKFYLPS